MKTVIFILLPLLLCRCASIEKSVGLGVGIGAASGIAASQIAHYNTKGTIVLGVGGAIIGAAIAALLHKDETKTEAPLPVTNLLKNGEPPLADPEKEAILVPDKIEGDQFVEKHRIWSIKKPSRWQHYPGKDDEESPAERKGESDGE